MKSDDYLRIVDVIQKAGVKLNNFESKFVPSVKEQIEKGYALSSKQVSTLLGIYQRVTDLKPDAW